VTGSDALTDVPVSDSAQLLAIGGGTDVGVKHLLSRTVVSLLGGIHYTYAPDLASTSLSFVAAYAGAGVQIPIVNGFSSDGEPALMATLSKHHIARPPPIGLPISSKLPI
jgi:hypothetical protein